MKDPSDSWGELRLQILGLGDRSLRKTHYPSLRRRLVELERLRAKLQRSEAYLAEAQRLSHTGSWAIDPATWEVMNWSEEMFRILGLDPQQGTPDRETLLRLIHSEDRAIAGERIQRALLEKTDFMEEYRIVTRDGTLKHLRVIGHRVIDEATNAVEYVGTAIDVTERKRAEQRLVAQYAVTRILGEAATVEEATPKVLQALCECLGWDLGALWRIDREAGVLRCAELWRMQSVDATQFEAATRSSAFPRGIGLPGRVWASGKPACIPDVVHDPTFLRTHVAAREGLHAAFAFPILLGGEVLGVIDFVSRDIRLPDQDLLDMMATIGSQIGQFIERKRAEIELRLAQAELVHVTRVLTMGELAASIGHEIKQPIAATVTNAGAALRWLAARPPNLEETRQALNRIIKDGNRASDVIGRIRDLIKKAPPQKESLDINEAIRQVVELTRGEAVKNRVAVRLEFADDLPLIPGDRVQLQQVILNLMINAIEAMSDQSEFGRELIIGTQLAERGKVFVAVRDSGPGLAPAILERVFEPFYTIKPGGLGLGLPICRSIIEAHEGRLWAGANEPRGAVFQFTLPANPDSR